MTKEIEDLEMQISTLSDKLAKLRKEVANDNPIPNYSFKTLTGTTDLSSLFAGKDLLFAIHNMGQACRYCTLWADGLNGFLPHLEDRFSVVLLSKDTPELQQRFANSRGWRFRMASHAGGPYSLEQTTCPGTDGMPGIVVYEKQSDKIIRRNSASFGPGDLYCGIWHILGLAGISSEEWTPQYNYWKRPEPAAMEDGGENLCDDCCS